MEESKGYNVGELFISLPECVLDSAKLVDDGNGNFKNQEEIGMTDTEKRLIESILKDDGAGFLNCLKEFQKNASTSENFELLDSGILSRLLHITCALDSVSCTSALTNGELGIVPLINEMDDTGWSAMHRAADMHSKSCIELLLKKGARTNIKTKDDRCQLPLELALSSRRMDVAWNPNDPVEDLLVCLAQKDLTAVELLAGKTKELTEVAYVCAIECRVVSLATLLILAAEGINKSIFLVRDADLGSKEKATLYECVIREALSLGQNKALSPRVNRRTSIWSEGEKAERRKLVLCEIELLHLFGAASNRKSCKERKIISPLIRASQAGDEAVISLLLMTNLDVNDADAEGNSSLHWTLKTLKDPCPRQIRIIGLLLKHDAQVGLKNMLGLTAVHMAAGNNNKQALQILLSASPASVDHTTEMQETPLFFAAKNDCVECAELLLHFGANTEVLNLRRQRPIDMAKSQAMRYTLSPTKIRSTIRKYTGRLQDDQLHSGTREKILTKIKDSSIERCSSPTLMHSPSYRSLGGTLAEPNCYYLHCKEFGSVEDAIVISNQVGKQTQGQGFGFITFKDKQSVSEAIGKHYITINDKQVEIESAFPRSSILGETQKYSPKNKKEQDSPAKPQLLALSEETTCCHRPEQMFSVAKSPLNQESTVADEDLPTWLGIFRKWLPRFLTGVSKGLKDGEWYPLSSLKADFRATCGIELDHTSLGYPKLSDFIRSMTGICKMKVIPTGGHGPATHMVLLPRDTMSDELPIPTKGITKSFLNNLEDNIDNATLAKDLSFYSPIEAGHPVGGVEDKSSHSKSHAGSKENQTHQETQPSITADSFESRTSDLADRPPTKNENNGGAGDDGKRNGQADGDKADGKGRIRWLTHKVLEDLMRLKGSTSVYFLREFDFFVKYRESLEAEICFACGKHKMLWENSPCYHLLWCSECKRHFERVATGSEHKCVICNREVEKIVFRGNKIFKAPDNGPDADFPPFDAEIARVPTKRKNF